MDRIWSKKTYRLREIVEDPSNCVMYYLSDGPERTFVSEELMLIPEDTVLGQNPPRQKPSDINPQTKTPWTKTPRQNTPQRKLMNTKYILHK